MATAFGSSAAATDTHAGGTDTLTITKPTGLAAGDLMVAVVGLAGNDADFTSSGWTTLFTNNDGGANMRALWKIATSGDAAASNFAFSVLGSANQGMAGAIVRVTGTSFGGAGNLVSTSDYNGTTTTSHTFSPGLTPLSSSSLYIMGSFIDNDYTQSGYAIASNNPTWTERHDTGAAATQKLYFSLATAIATSGTASGDYSLTLSTTREATGYLIAVNETTSASGNHSFLGMSSEIFPTGISVSNPGTHTFLAMTSEILGSHSGQIPLTWTNETRGNGIWTNEQR